MRLHNWVSLVLLPVEVEVSVGGDQLDVFHTELAEELAREDALVICWACEAKLTPDTVDSECPGNVA